MSIEECKSAYKALAMQAFTKKNFVSQIKSKIQLQAQFQTKPLENAIKSVIGSEWETQLLKEENPACHV